MTEQIIYVKFKCEIVPNPNNTVSITSREDGEKMLNDLATPAERRVNRIRLLKHKVDELGCILRTDIVCSDARVPFSERLLDELEVYLKYLEGREEHDQDVP